MANYEIHLCRSGTQSVFGAGIPVALARYDRQVVGTATTTATTPDIEATTSNQIWVVTAIDAAIRVDFEDTVTATTGWLVPSGRTREFGSDIGQTPSVMLAS